VRSSGLAEFPGDEQASFPAIIELELPTLTLPNPIYSRLTRLEPGRVLLHSALAGLLVGLGGVVLNHALKLASSALENLGAVSPELPSRGGVLFAFEGPLKLAPLVILPVLFLVLALFRQMEPRKTALEGFIAAHHAETHSAQQAPLERTRGSLGRLLAGTLTLGAGVPLGRDGPFAGLGSWLGGVSARVGRLEWDEARVVRLSGVAAGLGLALHAPLAAAVFAVEVLYRRFEFELEALLPATLASIFAYGVYGSFEGFGPLFALELPVSVPALALPLCLLLGVLCAALGSLFAEALEAVRRGWTALEQLKGRLETLKLQVWLAPVVGLLLAVLIVTVPQVQGEGLGWLQLGAGGLLGPAELWGLGLFRLLALLLLAGIGVPGGVLIPTLVLGGTLGAVLGGLQTLWLPDLGIGMGAWTVLGACSLLSGTSKTPLSSVLLGLAWGGESLLPGLIIGCVSAYALSSERTLFPAQVETRAQSGLQGSAHLERVLVASPETGLDSPHSGTLMKALESAESPESGELLYRVAVPVHLLGQDPQDALFAPHATLVALSRTSGVWLPHPNLRLEQGDVLVLVATPEGHAALLERLSPPPSEKIPVNNVQDEPARAVPVADG